jgi:hypothetical protein
LGQHHVVFLRDRVFRRIQVAKGLAGTDVVMRLPALDYAFGVVAKLPLKVDRLRCITIFGEPWGLVKSIWQVEPFGVRACLASQLVKWHLSAQVLFKLDS